MHLIQTAKRILVVLPVLEQFSRAKQKELLIRFDIVTIETDKPFNSGNIVPRIKKISKNSFLVILSN
jgi:hypothetical protein